MSRLSALSLTPACLGAPVAVAQETRSVDPERVGALIKDLGHPDKAEAEWRLMLDRVLPRLRRASVEASRRD